MSGKRQKTRGFNSVGKEGLKRGETVGGKLVMVRVVCQFCVCVLLFP